MLAWVSSPVAALDRHSPAVHHVLAFDADLLVGYASVLPGRDGEPQTVEAVVAPSARGRGIGTELAAAASGRRGADARAWAHGDQPAARALATRLGLAAPRATACAADWTSFRHCQCATTSSCAPTPGRRRRGDLA